MSCTETRPSKPTVTRTVTCVWRWNEFAEVLALLTHVEDCHVPAAQAA